MTVGGLHLGLLDPVAFRLLAGIGAFLILATATSWVLAWRLDAGRHGELVGNLRARIYAWWIMIAVLFGSLALGEAAVVALFAALSLLALREFIVLTPDPQRRRGVLGLLIAAGLIHYGLILGHFYGFYSVFIPVYVFLFLPAASALQGRTGGFLTRSALTQWALMVCVFAISFAPALVNLPVAMESGREAAEGSPLGAGGPAGAHLLLFLIIVVQGSDVLQYIWGKLLGRRPIAPAVSPNKTWAGFVGGVLSASVLGAALAWLTPFTPWQAGAMAFVSCLLGFAGGLVMSSIKRDRGVKDFGALIPGHGGIMDRLDSLAFAAPVFFHLIRYFFT